MLSSLRLLFQISSFLCKLVLLAQHRHRVVMVGYGNVPDLHSQLRQQAGPGFGKQQVIVESKCGNESGLTHQVTNYIQEGLGFVCVISEQLASVGAFLLVPVLSRSLRFVLCLSVYLELSGGFLLISNELVPSTGQGPQGRTRGLSSGICGGRNYKPMALWEEHRQIKGS